MSSAPNQPARPQFLLVKQGGATRFTFNTSNSPTESPVLLAQGAPIQKQALPTSQNLRTLVIPTNLATSTSGTKQMLVISNSGAAVNNQVPGPTPIQTGISSSSSSPIRLNVSRPPIQAYVAEQRSHPNHLSPNTLTTVPVSTPRSVFTIRMPNNQVRTTYQIPVKFLQKQISTGIGSTAISQPHQQPLQPQQNKTLHISPPQQNETMTISQLQQNNTLSTLRPTPISPAMTPLIVQPDARRETAANQKTVDELNLNLTVTQLEAGLNLRTVSVAFCDENGQTKYRTVLVPTKVPAKADLVLSPTSDSTVTESSKNSDEQISVDSGNEKQAAETTGVSADEKKKQKQKISKSEPSLDIKCDLEGKIKHEDEWEVPHYDLSDYMCVEDFEHDPLGDPLAIDDVGRVPFELKAENGVSGTPANCSGTQNSTSLASTEEIDAKDPLASPPPKGQILREMLSSQNADKYDIHTSIKLEDEPDFASTSAKVLLDNADPNSPTSSNQSKICEEGSVPKHKKDRPLSARKRVRRKARGSRSTPEEDWSKLGGTSSKEGDAAKDKIFTQKRITLRFRGRPLDARTKQLIYNVYTFFETRKVQFNLSYNLHSITSEATGVALRTVNKVMADSSLTDSKGTPEFRAPRKRKRLKKNYSNLLIDSGIRRIAQQSFIQRKSLASLKRIHEQCETDGFFKGTGHFVNTRLKAMGFQMVACKRRKICVEKPELVARRYHFLRDIANLSEDPLVNIIYVLEADLLRMKSKGKTVWSQWDSHEKLHENPHLTTVFHAASASGFIEGALSVIETPINTNDKVKNVSNRHSVSWLKNQLLPKVPGGSVIVFGHERHDEVRDIELRPDHEHSKEEIVHWLQQHGVYDYDVSLPKAVLLDRCANCAKIEQSFVIDSFVKTHGCIPLHLPTYHRDLNPLEFLWLNINEGLSKAKGINTREDLAEFVERKFAAVSLPALRKAFKQARKYENIYRENDLAIEEPLTEAIRDLGGIKQRTLPCEDYDDSNSEGDGEDLDGEPEDPEVGEGTSDEEPPKKKEKSTEEPIKTEPDCSEDEDYQDLEQGLVSTDEEN